MRYRVAELLARTDVGAAGVKSIDINIPDPISNILIRMEGICPGTVTSIEHAATMLSKIEVVDGSDVLYSLTGLQAQAVDFYDSGRQNMGSGTHVTSSGLVACYSLNFGRYLWDELLCFDPKRFKNPQLKITFDENAPIAGISENNLGVIVNCFDEKLVSPMGFLMNKVIREYTPVANSISRTELPRDYPIRHLYIQARVDDLWFGAIVANLELEEDNRKHVILNMDNEILEYYLKTLHPMYWEHFWMDVDNTTGKTIHHAATQGLGVAGAAYAASAVLDAQAFGPDNDYKCGDNIGAQSIYIFGHIVHGVICIPTGQKNDPDDWWNAQEHDATVRVTAGASIGATETFSVITQQLRRY